MTERPGAAGLATLRFDAIFAAPLRGRALTFADRTFGSRIGWREITVRARDGARVVRSSVRAESRSDELRAYPDELLSLAARRPVGDRRVHARASGWAAAVAGRADRTGPPELGLRGADRRDDLSIGVILVSLLVAAFWGAAHALTPGHGKALVAGYLVGTKGRPRHAFLLGATVTVTHTAGVFALGLVTLLLSQFIVPERLYPWLTLVSGLLVVAVGLGVLRSRLRSGCRARSAHDHDRTPSTITTTTTRTTTATTTTITRRLTRRGILGVGIAAGLLPCPSALVVLLSAIALHRVGFGLALIVAFSLGLAATITGDRAGCGACASGILAGRVSTGRVVRALPAVSAAVIMVAGVVITARALPGVV